MAEDPEQVLPKVRFSAFQEVVEVGPVGPVEHKFGQGDGDGGKGEDDEEAHHEGHPSEEGEPHHGHARRPHIDDGGDEVEGGE